MLGEPVKEGPGLKVWETVTRSGKLLRIIRTQNGDEADYTVGKMVVLGGAATAFLWLVVMVDK